MSPTIAPIVGLLQSFAIGFAIAGIAGIAVQVGLKVLFPRMPRELRTLTATAVFFAIGYAFVTSATKSAQQAALNSNHVKTSPIR